MYIKPEFIQSRYYAKQQGPFKNLRKYSDRVVYTSD